MNLTQALQAPIRPYQPKVNLELQGAREDHFFDGIRGDVDGKDVHINLEHQSSYRKVGGILVEGDGQYTVKGDFAGVPVDLKIVPEDQVSDVGGIHVQTGTVYHVTGQVDGRDAAGAIHREETIDTVGGIQVQGDTWNVFEGPGTKLTVRSDDTIVGQDHGQHVNARICADGQTLTVDGQIPLATLAEVVSLRSFLSM